MIECCCNCYEKYINKDGNIDFERLPKDILKKWEYLHLEDCDHISFDIKCTKFINKKICKCICHKDGENIIH